MTRSRFALLLLLVALVSASFGVSRAECVDPGAPAYLCYEVGSPDGCTVKATVSTGYIYDIVCTTVEQSFVEVWTQSVYAVNHAHSNVRSDGRETTTYVCVHDDSPYWIYAGAGGCVDLTLRHVSQYDVAAEGVVTAYRALLDNCQRMELSFDTTGSPPRLRPSLYC